MKKLKINKKQRGLASKLLLIGIAVILIAGVFGGMFLLQDTAHGIYMDYSGGAVAETWDYEKGDVMCQKIVPPAGASTIRNVYISGIDWSTTNQYTIGGLSAIKSTDPDDWLCNERRPIRYYDDEAYFFCDDGVGLSGYDVVPGQTYYLMLKMDGPCNPGYCTHEITPGELYSYHAELYRGGSWQTKSYNARFTVDGYISLGIDIEFLSAGAYPSTIPVGGSTTIQWSAYSESGGLCNIVIYGDGGSAVWLERATMFSQGETITDSFTKSGIQGTPGGSMSVEVRAEVGGEEEAHRFFNIYFSEDQQQQHTPSTPSLSGDSTLQTGQTGSWSAVSSDQDGDTIKYYWKVDGILERTSGFKSSGSSDSFSHSFSSAGSHTITVKAEDDTGLASSWATKTVAVSTSSQQQLITISVIDSTTYLAISGATVVCNGETKTTESSGVVTYMLDAGSYTATVSASGYSPGSVSFVVSSSPITRTVMLESGAGETGEMVTISVADGQTYSGIPGATVICNGETKTADSSGVVTYTLLDGAYTATAAKTGYQSNSISFSLPGSISHTIYLLAGGDGEPPAEGEHSVLVEVYDASDNQPIQGATVTIDNEIKITNQFGTASFNLQGGGTTYSVSIVMTGYYSDVKSITVGDSQASVVSYLSSTGEPPLPPVPGIPGFELFSLIAAIGIAFYIVRRKRNG